MGAILTKILSVAEIRTRNSVIFYDIIPRLIIIIPEKFGVRPR